MHEPHVTILLATYNGERYLADQLDSIVQQTHHNWTILASDDGSDDKTIQILEQYSVSNIKGPGQGFAANFLYLIKQANPQSDYYAFSDQDDVWDADKLEYALVYLETYSKNKPALYCGRTALVDEQLNPIGYSPSFNKPPSFLNALVQNIGGGNTMVFNQAAFNLLRQVEHSNTVVSHDWWTYLLISGAGGHVFYDSIPHIRYRQHDCNLVGSNSNWMARIYRVRMLFQGRLKSWIDKNNADLLDVAHLLTVEHQTQLKKFEAARRSWFIPRFINMMRLGIYRQTYFGQLGLMTGMIFSKL